MEISVTDFSSPFGTVCMECFKGPYENNKNSHMKSEGVQYDAAI